MADFDFQALLAEAEAALDAAPYDTASCHRESDYSPQELPPDAAAKHIGMYLG